MSWAVIWFMWFHASPPGFREPLASLWWEVDL